MDKTNIAEPETVVHTKRRRVEYGNNSQNIETQSDQQTETSTSTTTSTTSTTLCPETSLDHTKTTISTNTITENNSIGVIEGDSLRISTFSSIEATEEVDITTQEIPPSPSRALGPPTLYCDGAHVIRRVLEVDGKFVALKKGDHCMAPLNLARGLNASVDSFVDQLADFDLVQFHHHFIVLDTVTEVPEGEEPYIAEFTNTPEDFILKANRVGYSGAFLDKASYKKSPLSDYKGAVIFKVVEEEDLNDEQRELVVERALKSIRRSDRKTFGAYNLFMSNCEHAATEVFHSVKMQTLKSAMKGKSSKSRGTTVVSGGETNSTPHGTVLEGANNKLFDEIIDTVHNTAARSSPQVTFALWNIFRFFIQILGVVFLHHIHAKWWFWAALGYSILSAAPVLMQSVANFSIVVYKLRKLSIRGNLRQGSFRHLLLKELFRCIIVGFGSSLLILLMPIAVWSNYWPLSIASIVALFGFVILNSIYSITVKAVHKLIIFVKRMYRKYLREVSQPTTSSSPSSQESSPRNSPTMSGDETEPTPLILHPEFDMTKKMQ